MQEHIDKFKTLVRKNFTGIQFEYREWLTEYHLEIVERIAFELCDLHPEADRNLVETLVWFHDFGKPLDRKEEKIATRIKGPIALRDCGFREEFISKVLEYWELMEQKNEVDLSTAPIEVRIISSADGASHFTGIFYSSYFGDNSEEPFSALQNRLREKIEKDWNRKIVLPEVKKAFESRYKRALELVGEFPEKFITEE